MKKQSGFTVIEVLVVIAFLVTAMTVAMIQINNLHRERENNQKKTAINAMYYSLEEAFHKRHGFYPEHIGETTLPTMDKELLKDPKGKVLGDKDSSYRYEPTQCQDGQCKSYTLRTLLDGETDFVKESRHK